MTNSGVCVKCGGKGPFFSGLCLKCWEVSQPQRPELTQGVVALRTKYRGYRPNGLAKVRGEEKLWEFTSWPFVDPLGNVAIYARPIGSAIDNRMFRCRKDVSVIQWSEHRQKAYREGFLHGVAWAVAQKGKAFREMPAEMIAGAFSSLRDKTYTHDPITKVKL